MTTNTGAVAGAVGPGRGGRMSRQRKRDAVLRLLRGEDLESVSRGLGVTAATLSGWRDAFLTAGEASLSTRPPRCGRAGERASQGQARRDAAGARAAGGQGRRPGGAWLRPFGPQAVAAMSRTVSPASGSVYGLARVCRIWRVSRATVPPASLTAPLEARIGGRVRSRAAARPGRGDAGCSTAHPDPRHPDR